MSERIDQLADELRVLTDFERSRLRDRIGLEEFLEPDPECERIEGEIAVAEARLGRVEAKIRIAHIQLDEVAKKIERKTEVLRALVLASTPPKKRRTTA